MRVRSNPDRLIGLLPCESPHIGSHILWKLSSFGRDTDGDFVPRIHPTRNASHFDLPIKGRLGFCQLRLRPGTTGPMICAAPIRAFRFSAVRVTDRTEASKERCYKHAV